MQGTQNIPFREKWATALVVKKPERRLDLLQVLNFENWYHDLCTRLSGTNLYLVFVKPDLIQNYEFANFAQLVGVFRAISM